MVNYEQNKNCFRDTESVVSRLVYGDKNIVDNPWISIFIPTYKRPELFREALESALFQNPVPVKWEIVVVDNEEDDGVSNATEQIVREYDNMRVLYYRNSEHMRPGDNFNRGILLSRGRWVMMLHDDDILFKNTLNNIFNCLMFLTDNSKKKIGAVSAKYYQFYYEGSCKDVCKREIQEVSKYWESLPTDYNLIKLDHKHIFRTGNIGGDVPSNGTTYNREAVMEIGGFNDDFGISADLVLFYCLENKYNVYSTTNPLGMYRYGINTMSSLESIYSTISFSYNFRKYVYEKGFFGKVFGLLFEECQHKRFVFEVIKRSIPELRSKIDMKRIKQIGEYECNKRLYSFYTEIWIPFHNNIMLSKSRKLAKKSIKWNLIESYNYSEEFVYEK